MPNCIDAVMIPALAQMHYDRTKEIQTSLRDLARQLRGLPPGTPIDTVDDAIKGLRPDVLAN